MFGLNLSLIFLGFLGNTAKLGLENNVESANIFGVEFGFAAMFAGLLTMHLSMLKNFFH